MPVITNGHSEYNLGSVIVDHRGRVPRHLGLLASKMAIDLPASAVPVYECAPPVAKGRMRATAVGWLELTGKNVRDLEQWLDGSVTKLPASLEGDPWVAYCLFPHSSDVTDDDGKVIYRRFSCAGFVQACFEESIGTTLVDISALPKVSAQQLASHFGVSVDEIITSGKLVSADEPWPILLPGYVLHALAHDMSPFRPRLEHIEFAL